MKKALIVVTALLAALLVAPVTSQAGHAPKRACTESGDVCVSAQRNAKGFRILKIKTAADYFSAYKVCVKAPDGSKACQNGRMRDSDGDGIFVGKINWDKNFPYMGPGKYTVRWTSGDFRSPRVGFHAIPS